MSSSGPRPGETDPGVRIRFVNHASFVLEHGPVRMISDPWIEGRVFDDGWDLLTPTRFRYEDFADLTHVWFSHEHPDHFNPPNLRKIPESERKRLTVLYQATRDRRVVGFCRKAGFEQIRELPHDTWVELARGIEVKCCPFLGGDSWMAIRTPRCTLLNANDCEMETVQHAREIKSRVGEVDVLLTQFSYASWAGNELEDRRRVGRRILERMGMQIEVFAPRFVIPFASFIYFCHEDNHYMNDGANRIDAVEEYLREATSATPVILFPGESWEVGAAHDSAQSTRKWLEAYGSIPQPGSDRLARSESVPVEVLQAAAREFADKISAASDRAVLRSYLAQLGHDSRARANPGLGMRQRIAALVAGVLRGNPPARLHLQDHGRSYEFDLDRGLRTAGWPPDECDVVLCSESLAYCFRFPWGSETLEINGRYRQPERRDKYAFFNYFVPTRELSLGRRPLRWSALAGAAARRRQPPRDGS